MKLSFAPLHPLFAAQADGVDLRDPLDAATAREIEAAMNRYAVLVFRGQDIGEDEQLAFTAGFGPMDRGRHLAVRQHRRGAPGTPPGAYPPQTGEGPRPPTPPLPPPHPA